MSNQARYALGIDLGTTNCVIAAIDLQAAQGPYPEIINVPLYQRLSEDRCGESSRLPSFLYYPTEAQLADLVDFPLETEGWIIGQAATECGRRVSGRLVTSAKSWLCHSRIDKTSPILPWGGSDDIPKISPLQATTYILKHLAFSWQMSEFGKENPIEDQLLTITLPASFDQTARALTLEACKSAGLGHARLLEEPQAAFYSWISQRRGRWSEALGESRRVLVCDIGGGTSDFSIVSCESDGTSFDFKRDAVGRHLLLGGDNMDLSIAHYAEAKLSSKKKKALNQSQWQLLSQLTRNAKERLLNDEDDNEITIRLPGSGTKVIGGLRQAHLKKEEIEEMIINGFFPHIDENYQAKQISSGLSELGLPYEQEAAITWHILEFIKNHCQSEQQFPDALLFNGGALEPLSIRSRIQSVLADHAPNKEALNLLDSVSLANAVACGAAFYSFVSSRGGLKIGGGSAHAYYLELSGANKQQHICLIPKGTEAHEEVKLDLKGLEAKTNYPVTFKLFQSDQFPLDECGSLRFLDDGSQAVGKLNTTVRFGKQESRNIPVFVGGELTELDTLNLELRSRNTPHSWKLEFDLRQQEESQDHKTTTEENQEANLLADESLDLALAKESINNDLNQKPPKSIIKGLEKSCQIKRKELNIPSLRLIADLLIESQGCVDLSPEHEATWLNACSFSIRPGMGHPGDELRLSKIWSLFRNGARTGKDRRAQSEWAILWRRIAPGLKAGWQNDLYQRNKKSLFDKKGLVDFKGEKTELWRMIASFEHIPKKDKLRLGSGLITYLKTKPKSHTTLSLWALERMGSRQPLYCHLDNILSGEEVIPWIESLLALKDHYGKEAVTTLIELSRKAGDRTLDVKEALLKKVISTLESDEQYNQEEKLKPLYEVSHRGLFEQNQLLGEDLPVGLEISGSQS
ncbi:MAG: Hsp70 family protein [Planctomycetes bacterium]|nr:Hsp70 family protein [Planctomycetota bacterium]